MKKIDQPNIFASICRERLTPRPLDKTEGMNPESNVIRKQQTPSVCGGLLIGMFLFLFIGCVTNADRYNQTGSTENDCTLVLDGSLMGEPIIRITSFNGKSVDWKGDFGIPIGISPGKNFRVRIPAGEHTLTGSIQAILIDNDSMYIVNEQELRTTFYFVAGYTYRAEISKESGLQFIQRK